MLPPGASERVLSVALLQVRVLSDIVHLQHGGSVLFLLFLLLSLLLLLNEEIIENVNKNPQNNLPFLSCVIKIISDATVLRKSQNCPIARKWHNIDIDDDGDA